MKKNKVVTEIPQSGDVNKIKMKRILLILVFISMFGNWNVVYCQMQSFQIKVSNNLGASQILTVGIDPSGTDGVDVPLGEAVLPPLPPKDIFDARLKLPTTTQDYSTADIRFGTKPPFNSVITYYLEFQPGLGTSVTIEWNLPKEISGTIKDKFNGIVINKSITGKGSLVVTNLALNKLDLILQYNLTTFIMTQTEIPTDVILYQNYPNPFNPETTISYKVHAASHVNLIVYDLIGKEVVRLVNEYKQPGNYEVKLNLRHFERSREVASGVYLYSLYVDKYCSTKKMMLTK